MVGGIHTVLASKAAEMVATYGDRYVVVGPSLWNTEPADFIPENNQHEFHRLLEEQGFKARVGRWNVPGRPRCILVDFTEIYKIKDDILEWLWLEFGVDSLTGGWDYVEPVLFGYSAARVIQQYIKSKLIPHNYNLIAHWHEWMSGSGLLYLKHHEPEVASIFTSHATILGRSISNTGDNLHDALAKINVQSRAKALGITSKFSLESTIVHEADCMTTVSDVTAKEAQAFFERSPDVVLPNALGDEFPNPAFAEEGARAGARDYLFRLSEALTGDHYDRDKTLLIMTSGRFEYINKGIDLAVDCMGQVGETEKRLIFFFFHPTAVVRPKPEVLASLQGTRRETPAHIETHELADRHADPILRGMQLHGIDNAKGRPVHGVYVPIYLDGNDPIVPHGYYELLPAFDLTLFPSLYEPWGYTPLESLTYGVPTVTTDVAGFGQWIKSHGLDASGAVVVLDRIDRTKDRVVNQLAKRISDFQALAEGARQQLQEQATQIAKRCRWSSFIENYFAAHTLAIQARHRRFEGSRAEPEVQKTPIKKPATRAMDFIGRDRDVPQMIGFIVRSRLPEGLERLRNLAFNLYWSWHPPAENLFHDLDPETWESCGHNPVRLLDSVNQARINDVAADKGYLERLDRVMKQFDAYMLQREQPKPNIAYFCMEYGLHECLPLYSGGLGILAGDHLKSASDQKIPLVAVGLAYYSGYFSQRLDHTGQQLVDPMVVEFRSLPMELVKKDNGDPLILQVQFPGRTVHYRTWRIQVGSVSLYVMDTDLKINQETDRAVTSNLYGGDRELRLQQEFLLGIGGRFLLQTLGYEPDVFHLNEGHASFLVLSRMYDLVSRYKIDFSSALEYCRQTSVFTSHTPVPAGHDVFNEDMMRPYFLPYEQLLQKPWDDIMALGRYPNDSRDASFSMTLLGLRGSRIVNGVSQIHGKVSRKNFQSVLPGYLESEVPVGAITNGVHVRTWLANSWQQVLDAKLSDRWRSHSYSQADLACLNDLPHEEVRSLRLKLKARLIAEVRRRIEVDFRARYDSPRLMAKILKRIDEKALVIGFARRFAPYKRATLLFKEMQTLERIVDQTQRPIIFLFAGKAHPADGKGQALIKTIFEISRRKPFLGRVVMLENYDMSLARYLVQGCDVWMNTPTRPLEASGTSGMKAAMNGVLNLSVSDGWWAEGYNGRNGWNVGGSKDYDQQELQDEFDSQHLYTLLETELLPLYFQEGQPCSNAWIDRIKESLITTLYQFSSARMITDYRQSCYEPAISLGQNYRQGNFQLCDRITQAKRRLRDRWTELRIGEVQVSNIDRDSLFTGDEVDLFVRVYHPGLQHADIQVEFVAGIRGRDGRTDQLKVVGLEAKNDTSEEVSEWRGTFVPTHSGTNSFGVRVVPRLAEQGPQIDFDLGLVKWA